MRLLRTKSSTGERYRIAPSGIHVVLVLTNGSSATGLVGSAAKKRTMIVGARQGSVTPAHVVSGGSMRTDDHLMFGFFRRTPTSTADAQTAGSETRGPQVTATGAGLGVGLGLVLGPGLGLTIGLPLSAGWTDGGGVGPEAQATNRRATGTSNQSRRIAHP